MVARLHLVVAIVTVGGFKVWLSLFLLLGCYLVVARVFWMVVKVFQGG